MRFRLKKLPKNSVLAVLFLGFVFLMAGVSFRRTLSAVNAMPKENNTLKGVLSKTKGEINAVYGEGMLHFNSLPLINKGTYIEVNGLMARLMGQRRMNGVVKLNNGYLTDLRERIDKSRYISRLKKLRELCKSRNIEFLYVMAPNKICKYDKQLPVGFSDFSNENMDEFMSLAHDAGIEAIDLREELHTDGLDHYEAFFKTDHHWKPETGFWAANKIREYFTRKGILTNNDRKVSDLSNFNVDIYPDIFMGSYSRRVGANFGGQLDDISLIYPQFSTSLRLTQNGIEKLGSFKDVFFDMSNMAASFEKDVYNRLVPKQHI
jgi:hypothetical protein